MHTSLLQCQDLGFSTGEKFLFKKLTLSLTTGSRIGLIGPNGSGKSSLLRLLTKQESPTEGSVHYILPNLNIGYVPQVPDYAPTASVYQIVEKELSSLFAPEDLGHEAELFLNKNGLGDGLKLIGSLSGGELRRFILLLTIEKRPDLLLLDEPTNHLDMEALLELEIFLSRLHLPFLLISHDRYFLNRTVKEIIEINPIYPNSHYVAKGNYTQFLEMKAVEIESQKQQMQSLASIVRREVDWLQHGPKARTVKAQARIKQAHKSISSLEEMQGRQKVQTMKIDFQESSRGTKKLVVLQKLAYHLPEPSNRILIRELELELYRGTRLGILGANGSGKTTLLKLICEELTPTKGKVKLSEGIQIIRLDQHRELPDLTLSLREALSPEGDFVNYQGQKVHVVSWARRFLFPDYLLGMPIRELSGGERARLLIARMMTFEADLLLLDEPTNDLDIDTIQLLEDSLIEFEGSVIIISHDRSFLNNVSTQLLALLGEGETDFYADTQQWEEHLKNSRLKTTSTASGEIKEKIDKSAPTAPVLKNKLSFKEIKELSDLPAKIQVLEGELNTFHEEIQTNPTHTRLLTITQLMTQTQEKIDKAYQRWEELEARK